MAFCALDSLLCVPPFRTVCLVLEFFLFNNFLFCLWQLVFAGGLLQSASY